MWPDYYEKPNNLKALYKRFNIYDLDMEFRKVFSKEFFFDDAEKEIDDWWSLPNTGHNVTVVKVTRITI